MEASLELRIRLHEAPFQPAEQLEAWEQHLVVRSAASAAESLFIGRVRPTATNTGPPDAAATAHGAPLTALELEHYPGMTEQQLLQLATNCCTRHGVRSALVLHRIGRVHPGEAIVLVAIGADRRGAAQRCCQELLEALKHDAPFWKREWRADGSSHWLTGNTPL